MTGNAREWIDDCWHATYQFAPKDENIWGQEYDGLCKFNVLRGAAWPYNILHTRISYRNAYLSSQSRSYMWGFRLVRNL